MKTLQGFFTIKVVLITLVLTVVMGLIGFLGLGILPQVGWVAVTTAESLTPNNSSTGEFFFCQAVGVLPRPIGFPFTYFMRTNMPDAQPSHSIRVPLWRIGACDVPSFINPLAFLGNFVLLLTGAHLYRRFYTVVGKRKR